MIYDKLVEKALQLLVRSIRSFLEETVVSEDWFKDHGTSFLR